MFTRSNPKTPKLDIKKSPQTAQSLQNLKKTKWRTLEVDKNKIKEPQAHQKEKALSSQNKIVKI